MKGTKNLTWPCNAYGKVKLFCLKTYIISVLFSFVCGGYSVSAEDTLHELGNDYVLIFNTFTGDVPWSNQLILPIMNRYSDNFGVSVLVEHADMLMVGDSVRARNLGEQIFRKYEGIKPKAVILLGTPILYYLDDIKQRWGDVPVVVCNEFDFVGPRSYYLSKQPIPVEERIPMEQIAREYNLTHLQAKNYPAENIDLMKTMIPGMRSLKVVCDERYISTQIEADMRETLEKSYPWLDYEFISAANTTTSELLSRLNSLDPATNGVLFVSWYSKQTNKANSVLMANSYRIIANAKPPVFTLSNANVPGSGIVGGYVYSQEEYVGHLQEVVGKILNGRQARDIPFFTPTQAGPLFSYPALVENGFDISDCPLGSVILERPDSILEKYWVLFLSIVLICILIMMVVYRRVHMKSLISVKTAQDREQAMSAELANLFENMPISFLKERVVRDESGAIVDVEIALVNSYYKQTLTGGVEVMGRNGSEFFGEDFQTFLTFANIFDKDKRTISFPFYMKRTDRYYNVMLSASSRDDHINVFCIDSTDLNKAQQKLDATNHKLSMAIEVANIVPWKWDLVRHSILCDVNRPIELSDYGRNISDEQLSVPETQYFSKIHKEDRQRVERAYRLLIEGKLDKVCEEYRVINPANHTIDWVEAQAAVDLRDAEGNPLTLVGSSHVITARKHMESELLDAKDRAEESNRLKSAFLANMSHEIRTPLNAIVGFSGIMASVDEQAEREEYLNIIESNNDLLLQLIGDILDLSKIESGVMEFSNSAVDLNTTLSEIERTMQLRADGKEVDVKFTDRVDNCCIEADRNRITQVMMNLLTNALKFTDTGSITFGYGFEDGMLDFFVTDTGCGIPSDQQEAIFNRFVKLNSFVQGTGLGLPICQMIAKRMGGEITVSSEVGKGSTFRFRIPYTPAKNSEPLQCEREFVRVNRDKITILIAEDNESNFKLFETILKKDYRILHAWNGQMAVDMFAEHRPHLVLMDINMPVMNGYEATKLIKEIAPEVPVMAITAYAFASDEQKIISCGFDDYMAKPINARAIKAKIADLIQNHLILL